MKIRYNAPVTLTFSLACVAVQAVSSATAHSFAKNFFMVGGTFDHTSVLHYWRLFSHVLGHSGWAHLFGNMTIFLLLGPILEEKYGSRNLLEMILVTAFVTGVLNIALFSTGLLGASGVVFCCIILSSLANFREGEIPLTFVLVATLFLGMEVIKALGPDRVSQFTHVIGGICGAGFGFLLQGEVKPPRNSGQA